MENRKWLKRKYPFSFNKLDDYFNDEELIAFKKSTMRIGILIKDILNCQKYKKDSIVQFRRSNPVNDYNHPYIYAVIKCQEGFTSSGYHSIEINEGDFIEILL